MSPIIDAHLRPREENRQSQCPAGTTARRPRPPSSCSWWGSDFPHVLAGCGYVRNRNFLPREAKFLSTGELDTIMGGTAARLWFG